MYGVSNSFLTALRAPSMVAAVQISTIDGTTLAAVDGSVSLDSRRNITRTATLELAATSTLTAAQVYDLVMTPGTEIAIKRGLQLANGAVEYVPLGVFSTDTASISRSTNGTVKWSGSDRAKKISRARFVDPYQITAGVTLAAAGAALLQSRWAQVQTNFANVTATVGAQAIFEAGENSDPWAQARKLFADYGYDLNFDGNGVARAVLIPDPSSTTAVFDFGSADTNLVLEAETSGSFEKVYNGVVATGEGTSVVTPLRGEAWDTVVTSPTYYLGNYGKVPLFYSSPQLTTAAIAQATASALLSKLKGQVEDFAWSTIVNPALEPYDLVSTTVKGVTRIVMIDQLTIPLKAQETMTATARRIV